MLELTFDGDNLNFLIHCIWISMPSASVAIATIAGVSAKT
jgi:hypothetical protein